MKEPLPEHPYTIAQAIARVEGWYADELTPNRPQRNNNPGDLEYGPFTIERGATSSDGRFAIFPNADTGWMALNSLLRTPEYFDLTVEEAINKFAPPNENDTGQYVRWVCAWAAVHPDDFLDRVLLRA